MQIDLFLDESGVTGTNLTDPDHPYLVIASNSLSLQLSMDFRSKYFARFTQGQLQHRQLKRRSADSVIDFVQDITQNHHDKFAFFAVDKEFVLIIKVIQYWFEDRFNQAFKRDGMNVLAANLFYFNIKRSCDPYEFSTLIEACKIMFASYDVAAYGRFWQLIENIGLREPNSIVMTVVNARREDGLEIYSNLFSLEKLNILSIHFTVFLGLYAHWQNKFPLARFKIYHDEGTELNRQPCLDAWVDLLNPNKGGFIRGHLTDLECPLKVDHFDFNVSSRDTLQIQFSDIIAGAAADVLKGTLPAFGKDSYRQRLANAGIFTLGCNAVFPNVELAREQHKLKVFLNRQ